MFLVSVEVGPWFSVEGENNDVSNGRCRGPISTTRVHVGGTPGCTGHHRRRGPELRCTTSRLVGS